jgi:hypothetical protein
MLRTYCLLALLCLLLTALCFPLQGHSQTTKNSISQSAILSGRLFLEHDPNTPVAGADLYLLKTKKHSVSLADGSFLLTLTGSADTLIISLTGYRTLRLPVNKNSAFLNIPFERLDAELGEVIVSTGYQQLPKERATGSFVQIDNSLFNRRTSTSVLERLDGIASGLVFNKSNVTDELLTIRGRSTLLGAASASPLLLRRLL